MEYKRLNKLQNEEVRIEPTNLCNYNCIMCPRDKHFRRRGIMSMELYNSIIEQVTKLGAKKITLTNFGEPFIDPTLEEKIKIASENNLKTYVITNASLFHKISDYDNTKTKIQAAIDNGLTELRLSFYGETRKQYENIMKGGNYDKVVDNLKLLKKFKSDCEVSHFILDFDNKTDQEKYPDVIKDVVDYYEIWKPHNFGDGRSYREIHNEKKSCGRPISGPLQINWSGIVVACCYDYDEKMILGDVSKNSILDVLNSDEYNELRRSHIKNNYTKHPYCDNCDQLLCDKHEKSIIKTTNPKHYSLNNEDIVSRTNTSPETKLIDL